MRLPAWCSFASAAWAYMATFILAAASWVSPDGYMAFHFNLYGEWQLEKYVLLPVLLLFTFIVSVVEYKRFLRRETRQ